MNDSMLHKPKPRFGLPQETRHTLILALWALLICCVVIGSLLPAASPAMMAIGRLHVNDKVMHFCAYLALSLLPLIDLGIAPEGSWQPLDDPSRSSHGGGPALLAGPRRGARDVMANGMGGSCGVLLAAPRTLIAILLEI